MTSQGCPFAKTFVCRLSFLSFLAAPLCGAAEIPLDVQKSTVITFLSESGKTYKLLSATDPSPANWVVAQDGIQGTGGKVTVFYKSEGDQKLFFKVEEGPTIAPDQKPLFALAQLTISHRDLTGYQMSGQNLAGFIFNSAILDRANLKGVDLSDANLGGSSLQGADLSNAKVMGLNAFNANFSDANLTGDNFSKTSLSGANFTGANLAGTSFEFCNLTFAKLAVQNLSNRSFRGASFDGADLRLCDFSGTDLRGAVFYQTAQVFSEGIRIDGANCEGAYLAGLSLNGSDLRRTMLRGAEIGGAGFADVNLSGNDLTLLAASPNVGNVVIKPNLARANLRNAKLYAASLRWADLKGADLTDADLSYADFAGADLAGAIGFDSKQPGIFFGYGGATGEDSYGIYAYTTLPDGSKKSFANSGAAFAPTTAPGKLHFSINEDGVQTELDLTYGAPNNYYVQGVNKGIVQWGTARGTIAYLRLIPLGGYVDYTLLFNTPTSGQLFRRINPNLTPNTLIGTFNTNS